MIQLKRKSEVLDSPISRTTKRMRIKIPPPAIESLPKDILMEVVAKVASSSIIDLFNVKLVTKNFHQASEEGYIYRHVSFQDFPKVPWKNNAKFWSLIENCNNHGNMESLYRKGILDFFPHPKEEASGLANLKASAEKGHPEACYVYGVVLYSANLKDEGAKFLNKCEAKLGVKMADCRRRVRDFVWSIWIKNQLINYSADSHDYRKTNCLIKDNICGINPRRNGWDWNDEDDYYGEHTCEACKWSGEVMRFCNMLRTGSYNNSN